MPLFRYQAVTAAGKTIKGVIDADSLVVAKDRLRKQQVLVTAVAPLQSRREALRLDAALLLSFTKEVAQLLRAGLPLYEALLTIEEKYRRHKAHPLFLDLCDHLKEGAALSSALRRYPATFGQIYLSMVQVAEQSGELAATFEQLSQLISRQQKLKKLLASALIYPAFLSVFCCAVVCGLLFFVIPSMRELFEGRSLHPVTATVLAISQWANAHVLFLISCPILVLVGSYCAWRDKTMRLRLYKICLQLPFVKTLLLHAALVRLCRSLSMLLSGGVPLLEALELAKGVTKSPLLEETIAGAQKRIAQGERLSQAFKNAPLLPPLVQRMLSLSEETGQMQDAFRNLADIYDEEMERHLAQLTSYLQPVLLMTLGAIVGLVVLSILLPLTDVSSFAAT